MSYLNIVRQSIYAHSVLGLSVGVLLYFICLSGSFSVFSAEFERWEQPNVEEFNFTDSSAIGFSLNPLFESFVKKINKNNEQLVMPDLAYFVFPRVDLPRMHMQAEISGQEFEYYIDSMGNIVDEPSFEWTEMLVHLHSFLHLPETFGVIIVSIFAVFLLALILIGIIAHPSILKDAFYFRMGGNAQLEQTDLHNRLSVWGLPFHLMIAITGAFFGLSSLIIVVAAAAFYDGDRDKMIDDIYGADPVVKESVINIDFDAGMKHLADSFPDATPIYLVVHKPGTEQQFYEIAATLPGRLAYSEMYRYKASGEFINSQGLTEGGFGKQAIYAMYRLHFGAYGGQWIKIAYFILGMSLTIICVSGINIWLAKRKFVNAINQLWVATVWGAPIAFCISLLSAFASANVLFVFIMSLLVLLFLSLFNKNIQQLKFWFKRSLVVLLLLLMALQTVLFFPSFYNSGVLIIDAVFMVLALVLFFESKRV